MEHAEEARPTSITWDESTSDWTWPHIVEQALQALGGTASLSELYKLIEQHPKTQGKQFWRQRARQVLEGTSRFVRVGDGVWSLSSQYSKEQIVDFQRLRRERWPLLGPRPKAS